MLTVTSRSSSCRKRRFALAASFPALIALAGCMSGGSSTFVDALDIKNARTAQAAEPLPLDVANAGVNDGTAANPPGAPVPETEPAFAPKQPLHAPITANSLAAEEDRAIAALAPQPGPASAENSKLASLAPALPGESKSAASPRDGSAIITPVIDPLEQAAELRAEQQYAAMRHGQCKQGFGPKPKMINARRIDPAHKYYMEMRLRHTPPLPVGHVYIAYGHIGPDGEPLDEKLVMLAPVGGYAGATFAAAIPVTGVLEPYGDDCILRPIAAYRISLTAQHYEKLLARIVQAQADKPKYALWTYNCNHFMSDVAASVGILPPENRYAASLQYFYAMMDRNEGRRVARSPAGDTAELAKADLAPPQ